MEKQFLKIKFLHLLRLMLGARLWNRVQLDIARRVYTFLDTRRAPLQTVLYHSTAVAVFDKAYFRCTGCDVRFYLRPIPRKLRFVEVWFFRQVLCTPSSKHSRSARYMRL